MYIYIVLFNFEGFITDYTFVIICLESTYIYLYLETDRRKNVIKMIYFSMLYYDRGECSI